MSSRIRLGAYPAKQCPRRVHNRFTTRVPRPSTDLPAPDLLRRREAGFVFESAVVAHLIKAVPDVGVVDLSPDGQTVQRTLDLMAHRSPLIVGGSLPDVGARTGRPDLLVLVGDGYVPVDIKHHSLLDPRGARSRKPAALASTLPDTGLPTAYETWTAESGSWLDDAFQLAHYVRMLQSLGQYGGFGDATLLGGVVAKDDLTELVGTRFGVVWFDLAAPAIDDDSMDAPDEAAEISVIERYDEEFAFRLEVAHTASHGGELVRPLHVKECGTCSFATHCTTTSTHPSFRFGAGLLDRREWLALEDLGGTTLEEIAAVDVHAVAPRFESLVPGARSPGRRLDDTVRRARMLNAAPPRGYEPIDGWPTEVPAAGIEADFDIEWTSEGRIFQWGLRVRRHHDDATATYLSRFLDLRELDEGREHVLARSFADEIARLAAEADELGTTFTVFHWSSPEVSRTRRFPEVAAALGGRTLDLLTWWRDHFFTVDGNSIKSVARLFGYAWQVDDPNGLTAEFRLAEARALHPGVGVPSPELCAEARARAQRGGSDPLAWLLLYNESDVAAQAMIRDGVRARLEAVR